MSAPLVTVLLPVFNGGDLLEATLQSVLRQTFSDFEVLAIDDASTDGTSERLRAIRDPRVRVLTNESNLGLTRSLNRGLADARGELIARQDADDLSAPTRLEKQLGFLRAHPEVQLLGTSAWRLRANGKVFGANDLPSTHQAIRWTSATDNAFLHTSVMFRRDVIRGGFGGYDEDFPICQDYELWNRVAAEHPVANLPERLVSMREHPASMTKTQPAATTEEIRRILAVNWARLFPRREITRDEGDLLAEFRLRFPAQKLPALRRLLTELLEEFLATYPAARQSADFHATLCRQSLRIAYKFLNVDQRVAASEMARAFAHSPAEWIRQGCTSLRCGLSRR